MKIFLAFLAVLSVFGVFVYANKTKNLPSTTILHEGTVTLRVGEEMLINNFKLKILEVLEDSRCPFDVNCIQAGSVSVKLFFENETKTETFVIRSAQKNYAFGLYSFYVSDVLPLPRSNQKIASSEYSFVFNFKRLPIVLE